MQCLRSLISGRNEKLQLLVLQTSSLKIKNLTDNPLHVMVISQNDIFSFVCRDSTNVSGQSGSVFQSPPLGK